ncbi:unnamed protein product [Lasius platythorax]|uniref:Uncharacterized protein n=1 Tax=Lasius platythorax TaxID=488582 RepID=A0AAV2P9N8_9HYME
MTISSRRLDKVSRDAFTRCIYPTTGRRKLTADLTAGSTTAETRGCVASTEFSHERSHVYGGQRSTEWVRLGAVHERRRQTPEMAEKARRRSARGETRFPRREERRHFSSRIDVRAEKLVDTIYACMFITS